MKLKYCIILVFIIALSHGILPAQEDCSITLKQAENLYDAGNIEEIPGMLDMCLRSGLNKDERLRAYRLMILAYLFEDKKELAEDYMLKLLKQEPEYKVNESIEPAEFVYLFNSYRTLPVYSIGLITGINTTSIRVKGLYGVHDVVSSEYDYNSAGFGYQFGVKLNRYIASGLELNLELMLVQNNYEYVDTIFDFAFVSFDERQTRMDLPISATYEFGKNKIKPYIKAGATGSYMVSSYSTAVRTYTDNSHKDITGSDINLLEYRNNMNLSGLVGIGAKYKIRKGYFFLEARYNYGLFNQVNQDTRYTNPELIYKYFYIDNDFTLNNIFISVGYMYSIYKPKKKI
ncbi:MAG: outer membrane beta-barrel protein [Bacteroidota bacterium]